MQLFSILSYPILSLFQAMLNRMHQKKCEIKFALDVSTKHAAGGRQEGAEEVAGASRKRDKHRRSGFSDGSGSDSADRVTVKYQCIGEQRAGSSGDGSDGGS